MVNNIKERPILFQTEMVKAILEGRKTQTRRKIQTIFSDVCEKDNGQKWPWWSDEYGDDFWMLCKYGKPGDLLWVRETWGKPYLEEDLATCKYLYKADWNEINQVKQALVGERWKPSIHLPKSASRIWLMIEDIRVERVQEISEEDAILEGIEKVELDSQPKWKRYDEGFCTMYPTISFKSLWHSINGEESWNSNPWVWVIKFRVLSKTGRPSDEVIHQNLSELCSSAVNQEKEVYNA